VTEARTLGALKSSGFEVLSVRNEMRKNLISKLKNAEYIFPGIIRYQDTVIPQMQNAILSGQDIILLGERG
jgi:magnesium chelatase subunit I